MERDHRDEYIYDGENGHYVWYNNFTEAFDHMDLTDIVDNKNERLNR